MIGADRRSRMGVNNEDDDEEPLVIVADTDPNQPMVYYVEEATTMQVETACWRRFANRL
uniref:Uncharacterized protein n=1 Tax=Brassica campestris TaxID=3711 RepID=A0A3P5ZZQ3_BRACM|nr:unnamed protein product [Brassica rapa]